MSRVGLWLAAGCLVGCGELAPAGGPEDPLFLLTARLQGTALPPSEGTYRAAVQWLSVGRGAAIRCLEGPEAAASCPIEDLEVRLGHRDYGVVPTVGGFEVAFAQLPEPALLLEHAGARLAFASVALYDDRDGDAALSAADAVLAASVLGRQVSFLMYREGSLHPFYRRLTELHGCEPPDVGYSVLRIDRGLRCRVTAITPILAEADEALAVTDTLCGGTVTGLLDPPEEPPPLVRPGPGRALLCLADNRVRVYEDTGEVCADRRGVRLLALEGCETEQRERCWNRLDAAPSWWPCEIERE